MLAVSKWLSQEALGCWLQSESLKLQGLSGALALMFGTACVRCLPPVCFRWSSGCHRLGELQAEELQGAINKLLSLATSKESAEQPGSRVTLCCEQCGSSGEAQFRSKWLAGGTVLCPECRIELVPAESQIAGLIDAGSRAFEVTQAVLQTHEMALLMDSELEDAWGGLLTHIANEGVDAVTQRMCTLSAGSIGACAVDLGSSYVVHCINNLVKLTELDTLTSQLLTFLEQIAGARLHARHRHSALLQLTETLLAVLRERGKTSP